MRGRQVFRYLPDLVMADYLPTIQKEVIIEG